MDRQVLLLDSTPIFIVAIADFRVNSAAEIIYWDALFLDYQVPRLHSKPHLETVLYKKLLAKGYLHPAQELT